MTVLCHNFRELYFLKMEDSDDIQKETVDDNGPTITAVLYQANVLAVAAYSTGENTIYVDSVPIQAESLEEAFYTTKVLLNPTFLIIHPKLAEHSSRLSALIMGRDGTADFYPFKVEPRHSWNADTCRQLLSTKLNVKTENISTGDSRSMLRHASVINLDENVLLQPLCALLLYLKENVFHLDDDSQTMEVTNILPIEYSQFLLMDSISLYSLQIFHEDCHPNLIKGGSKNKEGYSLFTLFDRAKSLPGREMLRDWMNKPVRSARIIRHRQSGIALVV